jgi:uncharacterized membrane protein
MHSHDAGRTPLLVRPPLHPTFVSFPITCIGGTLLTDIAYWQTAEMMWADFSAWLIAAGVILGWLVAIIGIVDLAGHRYATAPMPPWVYAIGNLVALILATINMLVHTHDAWTSVVPWGLGLSAVTVIVFLFTTWIGWTALYRRGLEVVP